MTYVTGFLTPVKTEDKARYVKSAEASWPLFQKYGALSQVETWGEDVPDGALTSFPMAVKLQEGEVVVFSGVTWPARATADACFGKMQDDPDFANMDMPFDGKRMMWGGFSVAFEGKA